jgi:hypothetical protein
VLGENTSAHLEILPTVDFDTSSIGLVVDGVHQSLSANKKQMCEMYVTVSRFGFLFAGINFTDAHFGYQQFEDVFSFSCLLDVLNAYSSFLLRYLCRITFIAVVDSARRLRSSWLSLFWQTCV